MVTYGLAKHIQDFGKMKKKIIKLTENDIQRIVKKVINEDFISRLVSRGQGFIAGLKARNESRDARQLLRAVARLQGTANQVSPYISDIKSDLDKLFKSKFVERATEVNYKTISGDISSEAEEFKTLLTEYQSAITKVVELNEQIKNLNLSETPSAPPTDEPAV
jgi:hypothetical protein